VDLLLNKKDISPSIFDIGSTSILPNNLSPLAVPWEVLTGCEITPINVWKALSTAYQPN